MTEVFYVLIVLRADRDVFPRQGVGILPAPAVVVNVIVCAFIRRFLRHAAAAPTCCF